MFRGVRRLGSVVVRAASLPIRQSVGVRTFVGSHGSTLTSLSRPACASRRSFASASNEVMFHVQDYDDFQDRVLHADKPVVVQFHATWCGPCKMLSPRLESMVNQRGGDLLLAKADVDECDFALDYNVSAVPTVMAFKGGEKVGMFMGMKSDEEITAFLDALEE